MIDDSRVSSQHKSPSIVLLDNKCNRDEYKYFSTNESFIFALYKNMDEDIVSFVYNSSHAICDNIDRFPIFGNGFDLHFGSEKYKPAASRKGAYQFPIRSSSDIFEWDDWEVFLVSKA